MPLRASEPVLSLRNFPEKSDLAASMSFTKQELVKVLRESLEDYELPKQFIFLEHLPRNESGKVDKLVLQSIPV